jgi:fatty acid desaturase
MKPTPTPAPFRGVASGAAALRTEFRLRGWDRKATGRVLLELAGHLGITFAGIALALASASLALRGLGILATALGGLGVALNTHTASHNGTSSRRRINRLLTYIGFPFFVQLSATYWWDKHVARHHPAPNVLGVDDDADLLPWFALTQQEVASSGGFARLYYRFQWIVFPFALAGNGFQLQFASWRYVFGALADRRRRRAAHWIDLVALLGYWVAWFVIPCLLFPASNVFLFNFFKVMLQGYGLFFVLAPAHLPSMAVCVQPDGESPDLVLRQTAATVNFRTGPYGRFLCAGLDYQIEHHLFPDISHVYYPRMSAMVERYCRERGYPYRRLGWGRAIVETFRVLRKPKPVLESQERLREGGAAARCESR